MHEPSQSADAIQSVLSRVRALAQRRVRDATKQFWVEGVRQFVQECDAHFSFDAVVYSKVLLKSDLAEKLIRRLGARGVRRIAVTPEQFRSVCTAGRARSFGNSSTAGMPPSCSFQYEICFSNSSACSHCRCQIA